MISRAKLIIEDLKRVVSEAKKMGCKEVKCFRNIPLENIEIVIASLEQPQADKWIPCEERLPLPKGNEQMVEVDVTVAGDGRNVRVPAFYFFATCNFHVYGIGGAKIKNVIAWMPKPEPYKAGDTNVST